MKHKLSVMNSISSNPDLTETFKKALSSPFGSTQRENARKVFNSMTSAAKNKFGADVPKMMMSQPADGQGGYYDGQGGPGDDMFSSFLSAAPKPAVTPASPAPTPQNASMVPNFSPIPPNATHVIVRNPPAPAKNFGVSPPPMSVTPPISTKAPMVGPMTTATSSIPAAPKPAPATISVDPLKHPYSAIGQGFTSTVSNAASGFADLLKSIYNFGATAVKMASSGAATTPGVTDFTPAVVTNPKTGGVIGPQTPTAPLTKALFGMDLTPAQVNNPSAGKILPSAATNVANNVAKTQTQQSPVAAPGTVSTTSTAGSVEDPKNSKSAVPLIPAQTLSVTPGVNIAQQFPDGTDGGECGTFAHNLVDFPAVGDSLAQKEASVQKFGILAKDWQPQVGDVVISSGNKVNGHVMVINKLLPNGQAQVTESNYHMNGKVSNTRIIDLNDPTIYGAIRGKIKDGVVLDTSQPQDLTSKYANINQLVSDARAKNIGPDAFVSEIMQNPEAMASIFGGSASDYSGSANLSKQIQEHNDVLRQKYGLDTMAAKLADMSKQGANIQSDLVDYVQNHDQYLKAINPLIERTQQQLADPNVISNPALFEQATNYMNYLTTIKGGQEKRYADLVQSNVDYFTKQQTALTNSYTLLKSAYDNQVAAETPGLTEDYNNKKTALQGMYNNLDQQALIDAQISKAQSDAWNSYYSAAVTALGAGNTGSTVMGSGYDVKDEPYAAKILQNVGQTAVEIPATGDTPKQVKYFTNFSDDNTLANLINQGTQTYVTESTTGKQRAMSPTAVLYALTHEIANNANATIIGTSPADKNETYVNAYQPAIIKYLADNAVQNGQVNQTVANNALNVATVYINSLKAALNQSLKADPAQVTNVQNAAKNLLMINHTFGADQPVDAKTLLDPAYQAAWKTKFANTINPAVLDGMINFAKTSIGSAPADKIYAKLTGPEMGNVLADGMAMPLYVQLNSLGLLTQ